MKIAQSLEAFCEMLQPNYYGLAILSTYHPVQNLIDMKGHE